MMIDEIKKLIQNGEKIDVEFKESKNALTKDVFDTVCSFNNRNGGHILLGVNDKREIVGVSKDKVDKVIKEFTTAINNPQKMYPPLYLLPEVFDIDEKKVIYIRVPEGYQVCRHNGRIWDRSYEGDINITDHSELVYKLYARKQGSYFVNKVYPNLDIDFLDASVIDKAKKMAVSRNKNHIWENMSNEELLRSANLILTDPETKREGITLAAILLFGKDNSIMSVLPQHKTDAIFRVENKDRYDDRDVVITNLIDSYDRLIEFGQKHLNDLFVLDGIVNVNARDRILREIVSNTLAHRDYSSGYPAKMIIDDEKITVENSNLAHGMGALDLQKFEPFPKNPAISKVFRVFREIGLADELGSGMRNTYKYTQLYSGQNPLFEEGDIFRTIIPLKKIATQKVGGDNVAQGVAHDVAQGVAHDKVVLVEFIKEKVRSNDRITRKAIADEAGVSVKTIERAIKEIDNLKYVGSGNNGHWELNE
ncbi:TPA: putative DNA binding domain-containing protein [Streptococcus pyogenes]|nr:putative DNA binding domain-containing protein [Streptococcus pyogenes]